MRDQLGPAVAGLATKQHGVVEHEQLRRIGLSDSAIHRLTGVGLLHRLHRGVYAVGHRRLSAHGRRLAAALACGPGAVISHQTAGDLLGIRPTSSPAMHVSIGDRDGRRRPGIRIHRPRSLRPQERTSVDGIPVTTVARTLHDLGRALPVAHLRHAIERAEKLGVFDLNALRHPMPRRLKAALAEADTALLRSVLESDFLALCRRHGIPQPEPNALVAGREVDFLWRDAALVVELVARGSRAGGTR